MFDFVNKYRKAVQIVLFLFFLPFVFFGMDRYFSNGPGGADLATVGKYKITQYEFNRALRDRQEAIMRLTSGHADHKLLDSEELRLSVLDNLIRQRLLFDRAVRSGMAVSDAQLQSVISSQPAFQEDGKFSFKLYDAFLKRRGMTQSGFEGQLRHDIMLEQLDDPYTDGVIVPRTVGDHVLHVIEQKREVSVAHVDPDKFVAQVKLAADAAKQYYEGHREEFRVPEKVRVAYVTLTVDSLLPQIAIDPAKVREAYEARRSEFETKEERKASHILVAVDPGADAAAKKKAREEAQNIYEQLKKKPGEFAALAKKHSDDPGSARNGGDLGWFTQGSMVKAFDDAVFKMKPGEISGPVETEYGYHVIRLDDVRGGKTKSFEEVRDEIAKDLKRHQAQRKFNGLAENFNNIVFEQFETLKPAAELAKSPVRQSGWITREHADDKMLDNPKLREAIFSDDVLHNKRNSEVVEVSPGVLVAARIIEHKDSTIKPLEDVKAAIEKKLTHQQAHQLAVQEGRERLEKLKQGKDPGIDWGEAALASRADAKGVPAAVAHAAFRADVSKLPAYVGVENGEGGFTLARITKVVEAGKADPQRRKELTESLRQFAAQAEMQAFLQSLRANADVKVSSEALAKKE